MAEISRQELIDLLKGMEQRLTARIDGMDERLGGVERRIDGMDERLGGVEQHVGGITQQLDSIASDVKLLKLKHENEVMPAIRQIAEGHEQLVERLDMIQNQVNEVHQEQLAQGMALGLHLQQGLGYGR